MKKRYVFFIILLTLVGGGGYLVSTTFPYTGVLAVQRMSDEERLILEKIKQINEHMSLRQVTEILGEPSRSQPIFRPTWYVLNSKLNQIAIYFDDHGVAKIRWMKMGGFVYEIEFRKLRVFN